MASNRIILGVLATILLIIVILSSGRLIDSIRRRTGFLQQNNKNAQITPTPTISPIPKNDTKQTPNNTTEQSFEGSEIPSTGAFEIVYFILGGSLLSGILIKKIKG